MAKSQSKKYEVLKPVRHDGELQEAGSVIEIDHEFTAKTLEARGYIRPANGKKTTPADPPADPPANPDGKTPEPGTPGAPITPDPAMVPAAIKENDPGSEKVNTNDGQ